MDPTSAVEAQAAVVLLVDDDEAIRRYVVRVLAREGIGVVEAPDGRAALDAFEADPDRFAALFCDLSLHSDL